MTKKKPAKRAAKRAAAPRMTRSEPEVPLFPNVTVGSLIGLLATMAKHRQWELPDVIFRLHLAWDAVQ